MSYYTNPAIIHSLLKRAQPQRGTKSLQIAHEAYLELGDREHREFDAWLVKFIDKIKSLSNGWNNFGPVMALELIGSLILFCNRFPGDKPKITGQPKAKILQSCPYCNEKVLSTQPQPRCPFCGSIKLDIIEDLCEKI